MNKALLTLELIDDLVISQRAATAGGHESLDYIPGATLLGACAARLYDQLSADDAYLVFHSGKVRFGNARPTVRENLPTYPIPFCWHERKSGPRAISNGRVATSDKPPRILNYQYREFEGGTQPRQLRAGYVATDGSYVVPTRRFRMKTAINPMTGRAREAQLFGYESLAAGQVFQGGIQADDEVPEELFSQICEILRGQLRIGRSRSAEYGRVKCEVSVCDAGANAATEIISPGSGTDVTVWCLSDLALQDEFGQPTLVPRPEQLGLPAGEFCAEKSYLRTRSYAPFNAKYKHRDMDRAVIVQGSVLSFKLSETPTKEQLGALSAGAGLHRNTGLGEVWINSPLLIGAEPVFDRLSETNLGTSQVSIPDYPLLNWLMEKSDGKAARLADRGVAYDFASKISDLYLSARRLGAVAPNLPVGPTKTQWGRVSSAAKQAGTDEARLRKALFEGEHAVCKLGDPDWDAEIIWQGNRITFRDWLLLVDKDESGVKVVRDLSYVLATLAQQAQAVLQRGVAE